LFEAAEHLVSGNDFHWQISQFRKERFRRRKQSKHWIDRPFNTETLVIAALQMRERQSICIALRLRLIAAIREMGSPKT
jgi:hypothetical protein